jgi:hypothetical protein
MPQIGSLSDVLERLGLLTRVRTGCQIQSPDRDVWPDLTTYTVAHRSMRRTLGSCHPGRRTILLSTALWRQADTADGRAALVEVVLHETAHALTHLVHGPLRDRAGRRQLHGPAWRETMRSLDVSPSRCASGETARIAQKSLRPKRRARRPQPSVVSRIRRLLALLLTART